MGREVTAVTVPDAAFPGWDVTDAGESCFEAPKPVELLMRPEEIWYRLLRKRTRIERSYQ